MGLVFLEARLEGLPEANGLCGDDVHEGAALVAGEDGGINGFGMFLLAHNEPSARTAQGFVGGCGYEIRMRNRRGVQARRNQTGNVGDVREQEGAR